MLTRTWLYTAVTRGSAHVLLLGDPAAYQHALHNLRGTDRRTHLQDMLQEAEAE
jgi:ATP-dependent exoDNAse (exonuclease V) alpha subunit